VRHLRADGNATYVHLVMKLLAVLILIGGCVLSEPEPADPGPSAECVALDEQVDFFGEACVEAEFPAVTTCRDGAGWCIAGTCRPQCAECTLCDGDAAKYSDRGACYCEP
jgi:hypothetical protein